MPVNWKKTCYSAVAGILFVLPLLISGCGGGGSGGSSSDAQLTASLKIAEKVSVVDAQDNGSGSIAALSINYRALDASSLPASSDYKTDETSVHVEERSAESFGIINEILCSLAQTRYDEMLNRGAYKAQIDKNLCSQKKASASEAGEESQNQSSGASMPDYEMWTVESTRDNNYSPHIVKFWIDQRGGENDQPALIVAKLEITAAKSESNPVGVFMLTFKAHPLDATGVPDTTTTPFKGYLRSLRDGTLMFVSDGENSGVDYYAIQKERVTINKLDGRGSIDVFGVYSTGTNGKREERSEYDIAFDDAYFRRKDPKSFSNSVCLSRTEFEETAWRYGLYNADGSQVKINSGFPVKTDSGKYGWVGYYGVWFPDGVSLANGETVHKETYGPNGVISTPYSVFVARGKLKRHTKKDVLLGDIAGVPLSWYECSSDGSNCLDYRIEWNSSDREFYKKAFRNESTNWVWKNISSTPILGNLSSANSWDMRFWSDSLGGSGQINLRDSSSGGFKRPDDTSNVAFDIEKTIYPGDPAIPTQLACFENCPDPASINGETPYFSRSTWVDPTNFNSINQSVSYDNLSATANYIRYDFDPSAMELADNSTGLFAVMTSSSSTYKNGLGSGILMEPTLSNFSSLACGWATNPNGTCSWKAWEKLDVYYTWETGTNQWNRLTALKNTDTGSFPSFDPPLSVEYVHQQTDPAKPDYKYNNIRFYLEYNGFGDLHGIPGKCVDMDTGLDADCYDETGTKYIRWVPEFTVPDGSTVVSATNGGKEYLAKALEKEQRMKAVDSAFCSGLDVVSYGLAGMNDWSDPAIGAKPDVYAPPAVIGGLIQEGVI